MYRCSQIEVESKDLNSVHQVVKNINFEKIRISDGVATNNHDTS